MGLVEQALERAPRWAIKKLTGTYLTLALHDIRKAVKIDDQDRVRSLVLSMVHPTFPTLLRHLISSTPITGRLSPLRSAHRSQRTAL